MLLLFFLLFVGNNKNYVFADTCTGSVTKRLPKYRCDHYYNGLNLVAKCTLLGYVTSTVKCSFAVPDAELACIAWFTSIPSGCTPSGNSCSITYSSFHDGCNVCYASSGINGVCGTSNEGTFTNVSEIINTCEKGTTVWIDNVGMDGVFNWQCKGTSGSCGGSNGATVDCLANNSMPSTFSSLVLKTYDGDTVAVESGGRNQMCQSIFRQDTVNKNGVQFVVTATNPLGVGNIGTIQARLRNTSNIYTFNPVASVNGVATIPVDLSASNVSTGIYNIEVLINDVGSTLNSGWIDTGRDFKYWNCEVPVTGGFYNGTTETICPVFSSTLASDVNFSSLLFTSPTNGIGSSMTVNSNTTYSSGSNPLIWGTSGYQAVFNSDLAANNISLRLVDLGAGTTETTCSSTLNFDLDDGLVDPYSTTPELNADFSAMVDQDSWFQTVNGGVFGKSTITDFVPITCGLSTNCTEAISVDGLVAAPTINSTSGIPYSSPNDWYIKSSVISKINYFEKYKKITGVGTTLIEGNLSDDNVINEASGLLMVHGNVTILQDKITPEGDFLMVVASGDITVDPLVNQFDGILVGNNINIGGTSANQMVINGSLYGTNKVNITRSYSDRGNNNDSPAVVVNFRPDFIFNMPSSMAKNVVEWKWGN